MLKPYFYSNPLNNLKFLFGIFYKKAFIGPHTVMLDIEDNCDLHCEMCFYHSPYIEERFKDEFTEMSYLTIEKLLMDLKKIGTRKISICGKGEPFLHPNIFKILKLIKELGFYGNIITNGIHIDDKVLNLLFKIKFDQIIFSFHAGDEETYFKIHPKADRDSFENIKKLLTEIKNFKIKNKVKFPYIKITNVIFNLNYDRISEILKFAQRYFVDEVLFKPVMLYKEQEFLMLSEKENKYLKKNLAKIINFPVKNNINSYLGHLKTPNRDETKRNFKGREKKKNRCYIPFYQATIATNGDVVLCPYNQKLIGNIYKNNFKDIWFSDYYNRIRKNPQCGECSAEAIYPYLINFKKFFRK